jgi:uncharacterized protein (DUF488 family)
LSHFTHHSSLIHTVGHSSHPLDKFLAILAAHNTNIVIDVRRFPASRKWPHFHAASLAESLRKRGIEYVGMPELGGRRQPRPNSPHTAWRVAAFRGYADFMDTPEFPAGLARLIDTSKSMQAALLCSEALPWRCHRSLIADALTVRGWRVFDILNEKEARPHKLPDFARLEGTSVIYDGVTSDG